MSASERLTDLRKAAGVGGGDARIQQQHAKGKLTARERVDLLLDEGSFTELDAFVMARPTELIPDDERVMGDGVVTGFGHVDGGTHRPLLQADENDVGTQRVLLFSTSLSASRRPASAA